MKIAVPCLDDAGLEAPVAQHFGQAGYFTIFDTETREATAVPSPGHTPGKTPAQHLAEQNVQVILGGGMGGRAIQIFQQAGIEVCLEATGTVADAVAAYEKGELASGPEARACADGHSH